MCTSIMIVWLTWVYRDREWQKWPVTIVTGVYIGYIAGKSLGWMYPGKRLPL